MNKRNKLSAIICTLLAVMMIAVFIPAVPGEAYAAEQIKVTAVDVQSLGADLYNYKSDLGFALDYLIDMENDPPVSEPELDEGETDIYQVNHDRYMELLDDARNNVYNTMDSLIGVGCDVSQHKETLLGLHQDYLDGKITAAEYKEKGSKCIDDACDLADDLYETLEAAEEEAASEKQREDEEAEQAKEEAAKRDPSNYYTPGKDIKMSKIQDKLLVDSNWQGMRAEGYGDDDCQIVSVKKDKSLWDLSRNKKIISKVRDFRVVTNSNYSNSFLVIRTNNDLVYVWRKSSSKWGTKKLATGVKEFAEIVGDEDELRTFYIVKKNGSFTRGRLRFNRDGSKMLGCKFKKISGGVDHAYVSKGMYDNGKDELPKDVLTYFVLKKNGRLYAWGTNYHGEIGNGKTKKAKKPVLVMKNVADFKCIWQWDEILANYGGSTCYAIKKNGDLYAWGHGQGITTLTGYYPDGYFNGVQKPLKLLSNVSMVDGDSFDRNFIALTKDGVLWAWGNKAGSKGNFSTDEGGWGVDWDSYDEAGMTKIATNVIAADTNGTTILFIKKNKTLWYRGWAPGSKYKTSLDKSVKLTSKVSAVKATKLRGIFILKTNGTLYGTNYTYKKYHGKLTKLGTGFYK